MHYLQLPLIEFLELIANIEPLKRGDLHSRDHNLTEIEINEYFQKKTNDFDKNLVTLVLQEMAYFKGNTLSGIQADICYDAYLKNGWEIPKIKRKRPTPSYYVNDYDEMIDKVDRVSCSLFHYAFKLNKSKLAKPTETKTEQERQYAENILNQPERQKSNLHNNNQTTRSKIEKAFNFTTKTDPRKHELILDKSDHDNLINWVTFYFENNFKLPEISQPIQKVNTAKGNIVYTFIDFFKQEHPSKTRPNSLFELIKSCFHQYRDDKIENLKKQNKPKHYDSLIKDTNLHLA